MPNVPESKPRNYCKPDEHEERYGGRSWLPHPACEWPVVLICVKCGHRRLRRCEATASAVCAPCGKYHKRDVTLVCRSGFKVADRQYGRFGMLTLTGPGVDELPWHRPSCSHGPGVACSGNRGCRVDPVAAARWNGLLPDRWSWFMTYLRRDLGARVEFFKAAEVQRRGVLHLHVMFWVPAGRSDDEIVAAMQRAAWADIGGVWFGPQLDVAFANDDQDLRRLSWYCSSYVAKTADELPGLMRVDPITGEVRAGRASGIRAWSVSGGWGLSMRRLRLQRRCWARLMAAAGVSRAAGDGGLEPALPAGPSAPLDPYTELSTAPEGVVVGPCAV
jgi:hypothetical protein